MSFAVGDAVHVASLGKGTVREVRAGGRYRVEIKGVSMIFLEKQLASVDGRRARTKADQAALDAHGPPPSRAHVPLSIDLHGMTVDEAQRALDQFLSDAILAGNPEVRVIHGRSGGRLKAAVHARLRGMPSIRAFRLDPANAGVTIVVF